MMVANSMASLRMAGRSAVAALSVMILLSGCASHLAAPSVQSAYSLYSEVADRPAVTPDRNERIAFDGFSVAPPKGSDWSRVTSETKEDGSWKTWALFWRDISQTQPELGPHTAFAVVRSVATTPTVRRRFIAPDSRRSFMEAMMNETLVSDQAAIIAQGSLHVTYQKAALDETLGYECFSYAVGVSGQGTEEDRNFEFDMELNSYTCLDPDLSMIVETMYSQLIPRGDKRIDLTGEAGDFLRSIAFTDLGV